jgi:hypothetical protein
MVTRRVLPFGSARCATYVFEFVTPEHSTPNPLSSASQNSFCLPSSVGARNLATVVSVSFKVGIGTTNNEKCPIAHEAGRPVPDRS